MRESVLQFGQDQSLVGVLTEPETLASDKLLVLVNSGVLHRVGACRMSVQLARRLAERGHRVFRFDYSGIGDSGFASAQSDYQQRNCLELSAALDFLQSHHNANQFAVHGLCSGALDAYYTALSDQRIVAISQIDGFAYRNLRYHLVKLQSKIGQPGAILAALGRRLLAPFKKSAAADETADPDMSTPEWDDYPPRQEVEQGYRQLVERGLQLSVIYTGSWREFYNYERQFEDSFAAVDFGSQLDLAYLPDANHLMTAPDSASFLIQRLDALLRK